jgi:hypothetical protein
MTEHEASRTLVKSPPELWAECSEAASLARHLGEFGEIRITKLEPETAVAWEGDAARGTVRLEPSGWGTKVILTAAVEEVAVESGEDAVAEPDAEPVAEPEPAVEAEPSEPGTIEPEAVQVPGLAEILYAPEPLGPAVVEPEPRRKLLARLMSRFRKPRDLPVPDEPVETVQASSAVDPLPATGEPEPVTAEPVGPEPSSIEPEPPLHPEPPSPERVLVSALDSLGRAHHRPFSRA